jgi:hypothetical protein
MKPSREPETAHKMDFWRWARIVTLVLFTSCETKGARTQRELFLK